MEPKLTPPCVVYPDKERLLALAQPKPRPQPTGSWRVWVSWGSVAAAVGGVLALLTPTAEVGKMPSLALVVPQVKTKVIETPKKTVSVEVKHPAPKVVSVPKTPQVTIEVAPDPPKEKPRTIKIAKPTSVRIAYTAPQPVKVEPINTPIEEEQEPSLWDQLIEPFLIKPEPPKPKQLLASFTNPFKQEEKDERY